MIFTFTGCPTDSLSSLSTWDFGLSCWMNIIFPSSSIGHNFLMDSKITNILLTYLVIEIWVSFSNVPAAQVLFACYWSPKWNIPIFPENVSFSWLSNLNLANTAKIIILPIKFLLFHVLYAHPLMQASNNHVSSMNTILCIY